MVPHDERIERSRAQFREAHDRLVQRLSSVPAGAAEAPASDGGWSAAQIGWHVAAVDTALAAVLTGHRPAGSLPQGFVERSWEAITPTIPAKLEATGASVPPATVTTAEALAALATAAEKVDAGLAALRPERASRFGITHPALGTMSLYQVGEFLTTHTIRHNAQAKRVLGR